MTDRIIMVDVGLVDVALTILNRIEFQHILFKNLNWISYCL